MTGQPTAPRFSLLDRDHSILAFNERVMDWARRPDVPELERLRYLSIVSSNLDEFFEVRMAPQLAAAKAHETRGLYTVQTFEALSAEVHQLVAQQYAIYNDELLPALEKKGIKIVAHSERNARQRRHVREIFHNEVQPLLMPVGLDPAPIRFPRWPTSRSTSSCASPARTPSAARTRSPSSRCRASCRASSACRRSRALGRSTSSPSPASSAPT